MKATRLLVWLAAALGAVACGIDIAGSGAPGTIPPEAGSLTPVPSSTSSSPPTPDGSGVGPTDGGVPDAAGDAGPCGSHPGPAMIDVGGYCIDSTEVTQLDYSAFLQAAPAAAQTASCAWKTGFTPQADAGTACRWDPQANPTLPVVCVDWCDATEYCRWAGKRLCGGIDGGVLPATGPGIDAGVDQWYLACSGGGANPYPYGPTYDAQKCNGKDHANPVHEVAPPGTYPGCVGGYPGIVDMVGNALEWENACDGTGQPTDHCAHRGGSWNYGGTMDESCNNRGTDRRQDAFDDVGFRCCSF